jgi:Arc/MetJ family transcription regulator
MANLTITIDDEALKKARLRALEQGTSVNALLRNFLESYAGVHDRQKRAARVILDLASRSSARSGGVSWSRDDLHER